ncbi:hypothetical protein LXL04_025420 [Taraxacum kok-saghyz]
MRRAVLLNGSIFCPRKLGYVVVFVALFCVFLVNLWEGSHWIHKDTWKPQFIDENEPTLYYQKEFDQHSIASKYCSLSYLKTKTSTSKDCEKEEWQENLSKSCHCDDHDHLEKRECTDLTHEDTANSPCVVKRSPIRALLTSPKELPNSYHRPTRKLIDLGEVGGAAILIGVVLTTAVATLGVFVLVLFYCGGRNARNALKTAAKGQKDNKVDVNLGSKGSKDEAGPPQKVMSEVSVDPPKTDNSVDGHRNTPGVLPGALPLPPGKTTFRGPGKACRKLPGQASFRSPAPPPPPPPLLQNAPPAVSTPPGREAPPSPPTIPSAPKPPPPPPPGGRPAPPPNPSSMRRPASGKQTQTTTKEENKQDEDSESPKAKLKPFFWDKVNAVQGRSMVWHHLKDGSFQVNEETMVSLFGYVAAQNKKERAKMDSSLQQQPKLIQIIDAKKSQNLAITLRALNVTTEQVCEAVKKGAFVSLVVSYVAQILNYRVRMTGAQLPVELIATLLRMAPSQEEELKLRLYDGDINQLGLSERFLKDLVEIPFAFKRLEALLFMAAIHEDYHMAKESFATLEVACDKLMSSRLFLRLLEAVLKTGNRMNDGTYRGGAQAFKIDTLLKLSDVKGTDGKTTLLSFVVHEIIRYEGIKLARTRGLDPTQQTPESLKKMGMEVVSKLSEELNDVKKASLIDGENLTSTVSKLGNMMKKTKEFMSDEMKSAEGATEFNNALTRFLEYAEADITWMIEEEKRIMALVKNTGNYFHGQSRKDEGLRLFAVVRDFLKLLDTTCNEVRNTLAMQTRMEARRSPASDENGRKQKRHWQNTRNRIIIMKDTVKMILEALYDDDETPRASKEPTASIQTYQPGQIPTPPALPSVGDKLFRLAMKNHNLDNSDSDSGDWSSDDEGTINNPDLQKLSSQKVDDLDADDWNLEDDGETRELGPFDFEETNRRSTSYVENELMIFEKRMDYSNAVGWHSNDDGMGENQNEAGNTPKLSIADQTSQRSSDTYYNNQNKVAHTSGASIDAETSQISSNSYNDNQTEVGHTLKLSIVEETSKRSSDTYYENQNKAGHTSELSIADETSQRSFHTYYMNQNEAGHTSELSIVEETSEGSSNNYYENQNDAEDMPKLSIAEETSQRLSNTHFENQNKVGHMPELSIVEETSERSSNTNYENQNEAGHTPNLSIVGETSQRSLNTYYDKQNEAGHTPELSIVEETIQISSNTNYENQNEAGHMPELSIIEETSQTLSDTYYENQNEAEHTPELSIAEETTQISTDTYYENQNKAGHTPELFIADETSQRSLGTYYDNQNEEGPTPKLYIVEEMSQRSSDTCYENQNEAGHMPELSIAEETSQRSSDSYYENQNEAGYAPKLSIAEETSQRLSYTYYENENEAGHTPELSIAEETSQRSSDTYYENQNQVGHTPELSITEETSQRSSDTYYENQNKVGHTPELSIAEETSQRSSDAYYENQIDVGHTSELSIAEETSQRSSDTYYENQNQAGHTSDLSIAEETSQRSSDTYYENQNEVGPFDFEETNRRSRLDVENELLILAKSMGEFDAVDRRSHDYKMGENQNELGDTPELSVASETSQRSSDTYYENQNQAGHTPDFTIDEETSQRSSNTYYENQNEVGPFDFEETNRRSRLDVENELLILEKSMGEFDAVDRRLHDYKMGENQNEPGHTPELSVASETSQRSSDTYYENQKQAGHTPDFTIAEETSQRSSYTYYENQNGVGPFDFEETNRRSILDAENELLILAKSMGEFDAVDRRSHDYKMGENQNVPGHTPELSVAEETSQRSSDTYFEVPDDSYIDGWYSDDKRSPTGIGDEQMSDSSLDEEDSIA